jgi:hypothetical protein
MLWRRTQPPWGDGSWVPVCTAPCRAEVDANAGLLLHIAGIGFEELQVEGPGPHRVTMRPGSRAEKDWGFGLALTGGIAFTLGGVAWWTAGFVDASAATRTGGVSL